MKVDTQTRIRLQKMRRMCGDVRNKIVLDVGAGTGRHNVISDGLEAKKVITMDAIGNPTIKCDLNEGLKIGSNSVDVVVAGEIMEHMIRPIAFMKECNRVLKKNGTLVLSVPNISSLKNRIKLLLGKYDDDLEDDEWETHRSVWTLKKLKLLLNKEGFVLQEVDTNGVLSHEILFFPVALTPSTMGDSLIIKARKK